MYKVIAKLSILIFGFTLLAAGCGRAPSPVPDKLISTLYNQKLFVKDKTLDIQIVSSSEDMAQGLSGRKQMDENQGMLFVFATSTMPGFWMKDMEFNLDFIWINSGKIIGITPNALAPKSANEYLQHYYPPSTVDEVLEANSGWAKKNNINTGDEVKVVK